MSEPTQHGKNIAGDIQGEDAYGHFDVLTLADVWLILDNLHSHFLDHGAPDTLEMLTEWMGQLEEVDDDLPPI